MSIFRIWGMGRLKLKDRDNSELHMELKNKLGRLEAKQSVATARLLA